MQALYSHFQSPAQEIGPAEKQLFNSLEKIYDLYLLFLALIPELAHQARKYGMTQKNFPRKEDLVLTRFSENAFILQIQQNSYFMKALKDRLISWSSDEDVSRKIFLDVKKSHLYKNYLLSDRNTFDEQKAFIAELFSKNIATAPSLLNLVEEKNIFWDNSTHWMAGIVTKTIEQIGDHSETNFLQPLFKDEADKEFIRILFEKTITESLELEKEIAEKTKNWEVERIAMLDVIIMKMALTELVHFPHIPTKVTINEYLEIAKEYSTPGSNAFINGIIDNLSKSYKASGKIVKTGTGLLE